MHHLLNRLSTCIEKQDLPTCILQEQIDNILQYCRGASDRAFGGQQLGLRYDVVGDDQEDRSRYDKEQSGDTIFHFDSQQTIAARPAYRRTSSRIPATRFDPDSQRTTFNQTQARVSADDESDEDLPLAQCRGLLGPHQLESEANKESLPEDPSLLSQGQDAALDGWAFQSTLEDTFELSRGEVGDMPLLLPFIAHTINEILERLNATSTTHSIVEHLQAAALSMVLVYCSVDGATTDYQAYMSGRLTEESRQIDHLDLDRTQDFAGIPFAISRSEVWLLVASMSPIDFAEALATILVQPASVQYPARLFRHALQQANDLMRQARGHGGSSEPYETDVDEESLAGRADKAAGGSDLDVVDTAPRKRDVLKFSTANRPQTTAEVRGVADQSYHDTKSGIDAVLRPMDLITGTTTSSRLLDGSFWKDPGSVENALSIANRYGFTIQKLVNKTPTWWQVVGIVMGFTSLIESGRLFCATQMGLGKTYQTFRTWYLESVYAWNENPGKAYLPTLLLGPGSDILKQWIRDICAELLDVRIICVGRDMKEQFEGRYCGLQALADLAADTQPTAKIGKDNVLTTYCMTYTTSIADTASPPLIQPSRL